MEDPIYQAETWLYKQGSSPGLDTTGKPVHFRKHYESVLRWRLLASTFRRQDVRQQEHAASETHAG
jgi:hypothetical protein